MKINDTGRAGSVKSGTSKRTAGSPDDGRFSALLDNETEAARGAAAAGSMAAASNLFALQEVDDPAGRAARGKRRASTLLDRLDALRLALLTGDLPVEELQRIALVVRQQREAVDDPALGSVLDEIELRAAVELAKYGMEPL